jgi:hypothetical protein
MQNNPYNLKLLEEIPEGYLDTDGFLDFLVKNRMSVRKDNLPRFSFNHNIKMCKFKREGSGGSVPTAYKIPTLTKINEIKKTMSLSNNTSLGIENVKNKEKKILEIFDRAENNKESKSSIAEKVSDSLGMPCNRKLVRRVLNEKRSSKLNKLR